MLFNRKNQATSHEEIGNLIVQVMNGDERAKKTIVQIGSPAVEPLIWELNYELDKSREKYLYGRECRSMGCPDVMDVLGEIGDVRAVEPLMKIYNAPVALMQAHGFNYVYDEDCLNTRYAAAAALAKLKNPQVNAQMQAEIVQRLPEILTLPEHTFWDAAREFAAGYGPFLTKTQRVAVSSEMNKRFEGKWTVQAWKDSYKRYVENILRN